jgi:Uma2 family endonuclease
MSSVTTPPAVIPSPSPDVSARSVPSLNELYAWTSEPDRRVVIRDVDWAFYEQLVASIPEGANLHVDYDGNDLEIMSVSPIHDVVKKTLARFVDYMADELDIPCRGLGQTTWKRPEVVRGLEADDCYYFLPEKLAVVEEAIARWSKDVAQYPNPDLAIEVDVSPSKIDRPAIYAALRVAEVWRFDGERKQIVIERLTENGSYQAVDRSEFLPLRSDEIGRWVLEEDQRAGSAWGRRLRAWVRSELVPRLPHLGGEIPQKVS